MKVFKCFVFFKADNHLCLMGYKRQVEWKREDG